MRVAYLEREKEEAGALREGGGVGREILKWLACQRVGLFSLSWCPRPVEAVEF